jgi:hypothetical protein
LNRQGRKERQEKIKGKVENLAKSHPKHKQFVSSQKVGANHGAQQKSATNTNFTN